MFKRWHEAEIDGARSATPHFCPPQLRLSIVFALFVVAFGVRLYEITDPPMDFHPVRQYHGALLARAFYYERLETAPTWKAEIARLNGQQEGRLEPPILEGLAAIGYWLGGDERLWIPRVLSVMIWLAGGAFVYLIGVRFGGFEGAIIGTACFLLMPFGIHASRSFQPEPMMVTLLLGSVYAMVRLHETPSSSWWVVAGGSAAAAVFVKPVSLFVILAVFCSLTYATQGFRKGAVHVLLFAAVLLPSVAYYLSYLQNPDSILRMQAESSFQPHLLLRSDFWKMWVKHVHGTVGLTMTCIAVAGAFIVPNYRYRAAITGMWVGYLCFGAAFSYYIATHSYYQLQLVPIISISLVPVADMIVGHAARLNRRSRPALAGMWGLALVSSILCVGLYVHERKNLRLSYTTIADADKEVSIISQIGNLVDRGARTVILAKAPESVKYHGHVVGAYWPSRSELSGAMEGDARQATQERFRRLVEGEAAQYFIITDIPEFEQQPFLRDILEGSYSVAGRSAEYVVYRLSSDSD